MPTPQSAPRPEHEPARRPRRQREGRGPRADAAQLNAGPAGHDLVGIRDGTRLGIDDAGGTDTDAEDLDIGIRLESSLDGRLDTLENGLAALLGLGRNLGLKDRMGHAAISRILHNGSRNFGAANIDGANVLVLHVALLRR